MKAIRKLNIPFLGRSNVLPPNSDNLDSWYFNKGLTADGLEVINSKGTNAKVVQRLCAESDGATGYISYTAVALTKASSFELCIDLYNVGIQSGTIANVQTIWAEGLGVPSYIGLRESAGGVIFYDGTNAPVIYSFTNAVIDTGSNTRVCFSKTANSNTITCTLTNLDTGTVETDSDTLAGDFSTMNITRTGLRGNGDRPLRSSFSNERIVLNGTTVHSRQYEGSAYDISGNDNHGTVVGDVDFTSTYTNTDGLYSYLFNEGFDLYFDTATGLIPLYVPYKNGFPVVASVAGYTKDSEHPQETVKINNLADVYFDLGLDKSDVAKFNATCRASVHYNSSHPTFWHASELTPTVMQSYLESAGTQFNTLFSATTLNEYVFLDGVPQINPATGEANVYEADVNNVRDLMVYKTTRTESQILRIMKYTKREVGL